MLGPRSGAMLRRRSCASVSGMALDVAVGAELGAGRTGDNV